jgi:hypothetical protein
MPRISLEVAVVVAIALFWALILLGPLFGNSKKAMVRRAIAEGKHRVIELEGRKFHGIRKTEIIVCAKSGRGRAVLVMAGWELDPDMVNGKLELRRRWLKVRSLSQRGLSDHEQWVSSKGWKVEGREDIEYVIPFTQHEV